MGGKTDNADKKDLSESYRGLGLVRFSEDDIKSAIFNYDAAIDYDPNNSRAYRDRAETHTKIGNEGEAKQDITKSKEIEAFI